MKSTQIKSLGSRRIGGYGILFSDENNPDLEGEFFTKDTYFWLDTIQPGAFLFDHTMTPLPEDIKAVRLAYPGLTDHKAIWEQARQVASTRPPQRYKVGKVDNYYADEVGIFFECILEEHNEYADYVLDLIDMGIMGYSTDSVDHLMDKESRANGTKWIKAWAIPAISATHHPAEPRNFLSVMKHLLARQELAEQSESATKATLLRASQAHKTDTDKHEDKTMALNLTDASRLTVAKIFLRDNTDVDFKSIDWKALAAKTMDEEAVSETDATKEAGNELEALVMPLATQFSTIFGGTMEEAMATIMAAGIAMQQAATAPAETVIEETPAAFETEATMGIPVKFNRAKVKAAMGHYQTKDVNFLRRDAAKAPGLARFIKAVLRPGVSDNANFLDKHHREAVKNWKAMGIEPDTSGGFLTTPEKNGEVIENLRAEAVVANMVRNIPMKSNVLEIPRVDTGVTVRNVSENGQIVDSTPEIGNVTATAVKLAVLVKFSREIIDDSDPDVEAVIREDISRALAEKLDSQIIRGEGINNQLLGLLNRVVGTGGGSIVATPVSGGTLEYTDLTQAQERLEEANVRIDDRVQWLLDPKGKRITRELEDNSGRLIFTGGGEGTQASGRVPDYLLDYTWRQSNTLVPAGTSARNIFLAQWQDVVLGMRKQIEFMASDQAGTAFEYDQLWLRAIMRVALLVRHDESVQILTGITSAEPGGA